MVDVTTDCDEIGHQFTLDRCVFCGASLGDMPVEIGKPVYNPSLVPDGAVISSSCGRATVTVRNATYLLTTPCECGESQIRLKAAAWRCGGITLESMPLVASGNGGVK